MQVTRNIPSHVHIENFDELLIEQTSRSLWIHFAVRPFVNRRRVRLMKG